jgi:hypothetical protein
MKWFVIAQRFVVEPPGRLISNGLPLAILCGIPKRRQRYLQLEGQVRCSAGLGSFVFTPAYFNNPNLE